MTTSVRRARVLPATTATTANKLDEAARRLLEACEARYTASSFEVRCDDRHTVWVRRSDGTRSVGLPAWTLREHPLEEVFARVDRKLGGEKVASM